jgi:hypothetical protein
MKLILKKFRLGRSNLRASVSLALIGTGVLCATNPARAASLEQALSAYDAAISADSTEAIAKLTNSVTLDGTAGAPFNFGATFGDTTMEFVLAGDPVATGDSGYLAVGENTTSSLRYEQWQNSHAMGFTQGGVADYMFTPSVPSPDGATHLTFVWKSAELTLEVYVNGILAGKATGVSDAFGLPGGEGFLGNNAGGTEGMVGTIYRVTVYPGILPETKIKSHAEALTFATVASFAATPGTILCKAPLS